MAVKYKRIFHSFIITTLYHHHDNPPFVDNEEPNVVCNPIFICFHSVGSMFTLLYFSKHRLHSHHITFSPNHNHIKNNVFFLLTCFYFSFGSLLLSLSLRSANPRLSILFLSINPLSHPIISNLLKIKHTLLTCPYDIADMHATGVDTCHCCSCFLSSILHILS